MRPKFWREPHRTGSFGPGGGPPARGPLISVAQSIVDGVSAGPGLPPSLAMISA